MSQENVEIVRQVFDAFAQMQPSLRRGDLPIGPPFAEDIEWDASEMRLPDIGDGHLRGREEVRRFWVSWLAAWEEVSIEYELYDAGDTVVAVIDQQHRGRQIETAAIRYGQVFHFDDGEVVRWKLYMNHRAALEAAGVS